ncbi:hypothetical protein GCM10009087_41200 [Sphingomonas oligophenolica]|uniref:Uncharacterized protein n=1 Tax=Sphingomonas oligophenolica TaxID=301154 RepID=A0ABU9YD10_9SPHN
MQRILFGDNQFFGVNHMSEDKAREQAIRFQDLSAIIRTLDYAYDAGIRVFMCTTHERIAQVCDHFRANQARYADFEFYPCMPYAHKYANAVTELGIAGALNNFLPSEGRLGVLLKGGVSVARKDVEGLGKLLIDAEMKMFDGLQTPVVFVQNVLTDLILGLGAYDAFCVFAEHIKERYNAEPGYITMNLPMLLDALDKVGIVNPIVCANINKIAFRTSGGLDRYERAIAERPFRAIAMSVFASGAIPPGEAIDYVCAQTKIESILFGASSRGNIESTVALIREYDRKYERLPLQSAP